MTIVDDVRASLLAEGGAFVVANEPVRGIPMRVFRQRHRSLRDLADASLDRPDHPFLSSATRDLTAHETMHTARSVAAALHERYGVSKGDRVAILAANHVDWALAWWGAVHLGAIAVALNGWWSADEILYALGDSSPIVLVADAPRLRRLEPCIANVPALRGVLLIGDGTRDPDIAAPFGGADVQPFTDLTTGSEFSGTVDNDEDDPVAIFYTSGTTGRSKGAIATHRSWIAAVQSLQFAAAAGALAAARTTRSAPTAPPAQAGTALVTMPLFHISGCHGTLVTALVAGQRQVLLDGKFDAQRVIELIESERITRWTCVPTMAWRVCSHPARHTHDLSSMAAISYGGAPCPPDLPRMIAETFPNVRSVSNAYGLTESGTVVTVISGPELAARPRSVGRPHPVVEIRIADGGGSDLPAHAVGEIWLRGPLVMPGYWDRPDATAEVLDADGWLHTGDLGYLDDEGYLFLTDRARDMIIRGGENVYCVEIERRLEEHSSVAEAAVVGVPHDELGEEVKAIVRLAPDANAVTADELRRWVAEALAYFKVPAHLEFRDDPLPRNPTGKILKNLLRGGTSGFAETL